MWQPEWEWGLRENDTCICMAESLCCSPGPITTLLIGYQFSSVAQLCPALCNPMDCSMPGFPAHHQLPELTQTHVHKVDDAIQPSDPLRPLLLLLSVIPSIRVLSNESVLCIRWPKYWNFSFSINPSNEYSGPISFRMVWLDLLAIQGTVRVFSSTTVQKHQFFDTQLSL